MATNVNRVEHVSETALMAAACRAIETHGPESLICDPFADRLAGERGYDIAKAVPVLDLMRFVVSVRDRFMDELLIETLHRERIKVVVNIGAGLDTRPWRLDLPRSLRWIEADFSPILEYKAKRLATEPPKCRLEQIPTNLANADERIALFQHIGNEPALMVTEGLLMYLSSDLCAAIASEPARDSGVNYWLLDVNVGKAAMQLSEDLRLSPMIQSLVEQHPTNNVSGPSVLEVAGGAGWNTASKRTFAGEGVALARGRVAELIRTGHWIFGETANQVAGVYLLSRKDMNQ